MSGNRSVAVLGGGVVGVATAWYLAGEGWTGLRPMTPDGAPCLGPTPVKGVYLNTGHGHLGWTMACGSGRIVSDLVPDRPAAVELAGLMHEGR